MSDDTVIEAEAVGQDQAITSIRIVWLGGADDNLAQLQDFISFVIALDPILTPESRNEVVQALVQAPTDGERLNRTTARNGIRYRFEQLSSDQVLSANPA